MTGLAPRLLLCAIALLLAGAALAQPAVKINEVGPSPVSLTTYLAVLEDSSLALGLADVGRPEIAARFVGIDRPARALNYGYSRSAFWIRLKLLNTAAEPADRLLEIGSSPLGSIQFFMPGADGTHQSVDTGMTRPFSSRPYPNRNYVFLLHLPAQSETVVHLRIKSTNPTVIPAQLWEPESFRRAERADYTVQGLYFGIVLAMIVFNLILWIGLRDIMYLLYVNFLFWFSLTIASQTGLGREILWPDAGAIAEVFTTCGMSLSLASMMVFMRRMLDLRRHSPRIDNVVLGIITLLVFVIVGCTIDYPFVIAFIGHVIAIGALFTLAISIWRSRHGQRTAYFFVMAFVTLILLAVVTVLRNNGILPANAFTSNAIQMGSPIEMMLLAFALADRFIQMRKDKDEAQAARLAVEQTLVETLKRSEAELEQRVTDRTRDLADANQRLRESEELLRNIAHHDALTGLANRLLFQAHIGQAVKRAQRTGETLALMMIDLDGFKPVNDRHGHEAGDFLLREIAARFARGVRDSDFVARLGGDEFVAVLESVRGPADALQVGDKLIAEAGQPIRLPDGTDVRVGASIGIVLATSAAHTPEWLMQRADEAMYAAKAAGRSCCRFADAEDAGHGDSLPLD